MISKSTPKTTSTATINFKKDFQSIRNNQKKQKPSDDPCVAVHVASPLPLLFRRRTKMPRGFALKELQGKRLMFSRYRSSRGSKTHPAFVITCVFFWGGRDGAVFDTLFKHLEPKGPEPKGLEPKWGIEMNASEDPQPRHARQRCRKCRRKTGQTNKPERRSTADPMANHSDQVRTSKGSKSRKNATSRL